MSLTETLPDWAMLHPLPAEDRVQVAAARAAGAARKGAIRDASARPAFNAIAAAVPLADGVTYEEGQVGGVPGWWCRPSTSVPARRLLFVHGGGYLLGSAAAFRPFAGQIAARLGADAFVPDYRLAPEHRFPAGLDDVRAAYTALAAEHGPVALAGDSAGGGLILALLPMLRDAGAPMPSAAAVMSPWTDLTLSGASMATRADADPVFTRDALAAVAGQYLNGADPRDARASPLFADLTGLPPIRIDVGDDEVLLDDSVRYAEAARLAGVAADLHVWQGMSHVVPTKLSTLQASREALFGLCGFLGDHLHRAGQPPSR